MKKFVFAAVATVISAQSFASEGNLRFVAVDNSPFSSICVIAAEQGVAAARKSAPREFNQDIKCNGQAISQFARQFRADAPVQASNVVYQFVVADERPESMLCKQAVSAGVESLGLTRRQMDGIFCNGVRLTSFAKAYQAN
ncbi:hypothetical protein [Bowmanella denitrificans]|uniref:hypothetical protein n=1 Tax=Bowmanella denitrificans TaxID=366582 RepID=UPI000C9AF442|nr:hypothetical protein [Bowmanella denitrificans]